MSEKRLELHDGHYLGKGSKRICYRHPDDDLKCIKFDLNRRRRFTAEEVRHYNRYARKGIVFDVIAPYHGEVRTNSGTGYVFGLARDFNGEVSQSVSHYLKSCQDEALLDDLFAGMVHLKYYMISNGITLTLLEDHNMVYQRVDQSTGKVILIDGIGNNQFFPLADIGRFTDVSCPKGCSSKMVQVRKEYDEGV